MNTDYPITYITFITTTNEVKYGNFEAYYRGGFGASLSMALVNPFAITRRISIVDEDWAIFFCFFFNIFFHKNNLRKIQNLSWREIFVEMKRMPWATTFMRVNPFFALLSFLKCKIRALSIEQRRSHFFWFTANIKIRHWSLPDLSNCLLLSSYVTIYISTFIFPLFLSFYLNVLFFYSVCFFFCFFFTISFFLSTFLSFCFSVLSVYFFLSTFLSFCLSVLFSFFFNSLPFWIDCQLFLFHAQWTN